MFQTEERFSAPTDFLKKQGIIKVGYKDAVKIEETAEEIKICSTAIVKYYYSDGSKLSKLKKVEESPTAWFCAGIPKSLWAEVKRRLEKVIS